MEKNKVYLGDCLDVMRSFPDESIDCCVTSPPYFRLRDYGAEGQIGLEDSPEAYIDKLVCLFREIRRALKKDGTLWVNIGDSYVGSGKGAANYPDNAKKYKQGTNKGMLGAAATVKKISGSIYKDKDLIGIPWMLAFALRADGWYLRQDIIWHKPNPMPESVTDRCTKSHEYIFLLSKSKNYYFNNEAIQEEAITQGRTEGHAFGGKKYGENEERQFRRYSGKEYVARTKNCQYDGQRLNTVHIRREMGIYDEGYAIRNKRDVWSVNVKPNKEAHFATYPEELITPCILAGCPENGVVLDPFMGSGTTGIVARKLSRNFVGIELNPEYQKMATRRILFEGEGLFSDL